MDVVRKTIGNILYSKHKQRSGGKMIARFRLHQDTYFGKRGDVVDIRLNPYEKNVWYENIGPRVPHKGIPQPISLTQPLLHSQLPFVFTSEEPKGYLKEGPKPKRFTPRGGKKCFL